MINAKMVKILGLVATAVGMGATLLLSYFQSATNFSKYVN